jgi:predicted dinucleotide-binding enzyme
VLGKGWAKRNHLVVFGTRTPHSEKAQKLLQETDHTVRVTSGAEAAAGADVVVLATPWDVTHEVVTGLGDLTGKTLVDCSNPLTSDFRHLAVGHTTSAAEEIAALAPGAQVVKAFNTVSAATMANPRYGDQQATLFLCGDHAQSKAAVAQLAADLDFEPVDAGPLLIARYLEPLAMLYIQLAVREGWGSNCAFKIMRRQSCAS